MEEEQKIDNKCHSQKFLLGISLFCFRGNIGNKQVGDPRQQPSGMTVLRNTRAFTLIELLVVVLIIAILAAIAVPQYQKAVTRSRAAHLQTLLAEVVRASDLYYLQHGEYPKTFDDLDIDINIPTVTTPSVKCERGSLLPSAQKEAEGIGISIYGGNNTTLIHNIISVHFTTGKYKCRGFVYYQVARGKNKDSYQKHMLCAEYYYNRACGTDCEDGIFCNKIMGKKYKGYPDLIDVYE